MIDGEIFRSFNVACESVFVSACPKKAPRLARKTSSITGLRKKTPPAPSVADSQQPRPRTSTKDGLSNVRLWVEQRTNRLVRIPSVPFRFPFALARSRSNNMMLLLSRGPFSRSSFALVRSRSGSIEKMTLLLSRGTFSPSRSSFRSRQTNARR